MENVRARFWISNFHAAKPAPPTMAGIKRGLFIALRTASYIMVLTPLFLFMSLGKAHQA
jgi:hypothetical protein